MSAKIVCTIGPAVGTAEKLEELVKAGMNVARFNFSHGKTEEFVEWAKIIRELSKKYDQPIAIMQDLSGPKIRVGDLPETGLELKAGESVGIPIRYQFLEKDLKTGDRVLLDDGLMEMTVEEISADKIKAKVVTGGLLKPHKGVNLPGTKLSCPAMTEKDLDDLTIGLQIDADFVALSFVRKPEDLRELKNLIAQKITDEVKRPKVIAKIEKPEALENLEAIIDEADAILVARGDLGIELPAEQVPVEQKKIIKICLEKGKPVIVATQMLESMKENPRPTRAEVSDVANAALDGADALMLSAETSVGKYPLEAVKMMGQIIKEMEEKLETEPVAEKENNQFSDKEKIADAAGDAVCQTAKEVGAKQIVVATISGKTACLISRHRPRIPIVALTNNPKTYQQLALIWGVNGYLVNEFRTVEDLINQTKELLQKKNLAQSGDVVVIAAGYPLSRHGETNLIKVERL